MEQPGSGANSEARRQRQEGKTSMRASRLLGPTAAAASILVTALLAAGCSSAGDDSSEAATSSAPGLTTNAQVACDKYYALEVFRIDVVDSSEDADEVARVQALSDYLDLASSMVASVGSAVTVGDLPAKAQANADRILKQLTRISAAGGDIWDLSRAVEDRIAKSAARIEALCVAASRPAPQAVLDAREKAGDG